MKKAKVSKGIIRQVWPWEKTLPDGTKVIKEIPAIYLAKGDKFDHCIIDVPDNVQPGWRWNGKEYAPKPPVVKTAWVPQSPMLEVLAEELGLDYEVLLKKVMDRKKALRTGNPSPDANVSDKAD